MDVRQESASVMVANRFRYGTYGSNNRRFAWDVAIGARWNSIKQEVNAAVDIGQLAGIQTTLGGTEAWWEPTTMLRATYEVSDKWTIAGRIELAGFGVNDNDLQYSALIAADWRGWENASLKFGYVFYGIDFSTVRSDGLFEYDLDQHGPYIGYTRYF